MTFRVGCLASVLFAASSWLQVPPLYGAVPGASGDGRTDDTAAIQHAIDVLPSYGVLDGGNATYLVGTLKLKSRMIFQNFGLKTRPSSVPLTAPVTLDGTIRPISEVRIVNAHVDGNRAQQTNLLSVEDGGRSGFRIAGAASNILILQSSATNCATDGLQIFSSDTPAPSGTLNFTNIFVVDSRFEYNRRHGASADSLQNVEFVRTTFNHNGLPSQVGDRTPTEGESPLLVDGMLYGAGLVVEGYNSRTGVQGLKVVSCIAMGNARFGIQFWNPVSPDSSGFEQVSDIRIESCLLDGGVSPAHGRQAIEFNVPPSFLGQFYGYQNIALVDNIIQGTIIINASSGVRLTGGSVDSPYPGFYGIATASRNVVVEGVYSEGKIFVQQ